MSLYPNFSADELACRCGCGLGENDMNPALMGKICRLRSASHIVMPVSSAARCQPYNQLVSDTGWDGPHTPKRATCHAIDIRVYGVDAFALLFYIGILKLDFTGIGLKQTGPYKKRFIHLDDLPSGPGRRPRPWVWTYQT